MNSKLIKQSKFLSRVLRHKPESIGVTLDESGWVKVSDLLVASKVAGQNITRERLAEIVETNNKRRFAFSPSGDMIRASQGHSVKNIDLKLEEREPPTYLYHGTVKKFLSSIKDVGLLKMNRHHVHLSETIETATSVGSRRGIPIVLLVEALVMHQNGYKYYRSENGVWLTDAVPSKYIIHEKV